MVLAKVIVVKAKDKNPGKDVAGFDKGPAVGSSIQSTTGILSTGWKVRAAWILSSAFMFDAPRCLRNLNVKV